MTLSAAILAGGRARRLGGIDKGALVVGGRTILDRQLDALRTLTPEIAIVGEPTGPSRDAGVPVMPDVVPGAGALGGVYTALTRARTDLVLVVACDMPFLTGPFLRHLVDSLGDADVAVPREADGRYPLCAVFAASVAPRLRRRVEAGDLRLADALAELRMRAIGPDEWRPFDPDHRLLLNLNTPADQARADTSR